MNEDLMGAELFETDVPIEQPDREIDDLEDKKSIVKRQIEEALQWRTEHVDPEQEKATEYYQGKPFGDEQEGRSQVVSTDVRDAVQAMMPSFMRVFFGPEKVVEYRPREAEDEALAQQQTEYINYIVTKDNPGFLITHSVLKDALIRKMGVIKWWWEDHTRIEGSEHSGLTAEQVAILQDEEDLEVEAFQTQDAQYDEIPNIGPVETTPDLYDVSVKRTMKDGRARLAAVPPEEFIYSPSARNLEDARMVGHYREVPADELIAMGVDPELVERAKGHTYDSKEDYLPAARQIDEGAESSYEDEQDEATRPVPFADVYVRLDLDGDDISELRHVQAVGTDFEWIDDDPPIVTTAPFALFGPDPEPHTMNGLSIADYTMDLQRVKSAMLRGVLDSLTLALNPATEVVEGEVNMKDIINTEIGRIVRARRPGMMREVVTPFVGREALPFMEYVDEQRENRLGISKAAAGLDADALQSSTKAAVAATISAAQQRIELIARIFAETGMTQLYEGLLRLVVENQDKARTVRLRGEYVDVDPKSWEANMDVEVNVALGSGMAEDKIQLLQMILADQKEHLQMGSPLVDFSNIRSTYGRLVELAGYANSEEFYKKFGAEEQQALEKQKAEQPPKPDEVEALLQIEQMKLQQKQQEGVAKMRLDATKVRLEDDRERDKQAQEMALGRAEIQAKYGVQLAQAELSAETELIRRKMDADLAAMDKQFQAQGANG